MDSFVLGFVFDKSGDDVLLIRKTHPKWQAGLFNGIGGHIDMGESPEEAMRRECTEEAGFDAEEWDHVITFTCRGGTVFVFRAYSDAIYDAESKVLNRETLYVVPSENLPQDAIHNLPWIIPMIQDNLQFPVLMAYDNTGECRQEAAQTER